MASNVKSVIVIITMLRINMERLLLVLVLLHSVRSKCWLGNEEISFYEKVEAMHVSNAVNESFDRFVQKLSRGKLEKIHGFCSCKMDGVASKFCRIIFKKYYSTEVLPEKEKETKERKLFRAKALESYTMKPVEIETDTQAKSFQGYNIKSFYPKTKFVLKHNRIFSFEKMDE